jgi:hypothetical protein
MTTIEKLEDIQNRLENDPESVSEDECKIILNAWSGIPIEQLEAKLQKIRGEEMLNYDDVAFIFDYYEDADEEDE